jgi:hypothetical protein
VAVAAEIVSSISNLLVRSIMLEDLPYTVGESVASAEASGSESDVDMMWDVVFCRLDLLQWFFRFQVRFWAGNA